MAPGAHLTVETGSGSDPLRVVQIIRDCNAPRVAGNRLLAKLLQQAVNHSRMRSVRSDVVDPGVDDGSRKCGKQQQDDDDERDAWEMPAEIETFILFHWSIPQVASGETRIEAVCSSEGKRMKTLIAFVAGLVAGPVLLTLAGILGWLPSKATPAPPGWENGLGGKLLDSALEHRTSGLKN